LWAYEQERLPPTSQVVRMNRSGGPEGVIDAVDARAPEGFSNIEDVLSFEHRKAIVRGYAAKAGFAHEQVNRPAKAA
jgi:5-methylphenazine-1-carboxylate 1-monooxygenase